MLETNASDDSGPIRCAYQLCSYPTARVKFRKPTALVKMTRPADPAGVLFGSNRYPIDLRLRWRAGIRSKMGRKVLEL
eukprot:8590028-Pyramimonas_sp.AAC.2